MGVYSKGTRSKGVTRQFNSAAQVGNQQKSKKARVDAYLNKEAFMKEALARHMAVEEARVQAALNPDAAAATDAGTSAVVAAAAAVLPVSVSAAFSFSWPPRRRRLLQRRLQQLHRLPQRRVVLPGTLRVPLHLREPFLELHLASLRLVQGVHAGLVESQLGHRFERVVFFAQRPCTPKHPLRGVHPRVLP
mmetsp:Transcript_13678/g.37443  ORF Transcript_13678/g.37443 Transcript_13678/m.37443 type:complete len:191 (-) Transcript_13678:451-1023(-)